VERPIEVSVVIPTYNERPSLGLLHSAWSFALREYTSEIIVVDDNSTDGTREYVRELSRYEAYRLIERPTRQGLASAVLRGLGEARGNVALVMDADGSHPAGAIPLLVDPVLRGSAELALASRCVPGGSAPGLTAGRRLISWGARLLARPLTHVRDPMSGFFCVRRSILSRGELTPVGYKIALEILVKCHPHPIEEIPFRFEPRVAGESKLDRGQIALYVRHLRELYAWRASRPGRASSTL